MRVLLIRHAESENNTKRKDMTREQYQEIRNPDPSITEKGRVQSEKLGLHLLKKKLKIKRFYCSAMVRSIQTATIIQKFLRLNLEIKVNIHEVGGIYQSSKAGPGKGKSWLKENFPSLSIPHEVTEEGWWKKETKETKQEGYQRAKDLVEEFKNWGKEEENKTHEWIALVTHGAFMDYILAVLLERKEDSNLKLVHANTGLSAFEFNDDGTYRMLYINSADHLEDDVNDLPVETLENRNDVECELDGLDEKDSYLHRSLSEGFNLKDEVHKTKHSKKKINSLETTEEENLPPFYKQDTCYDFEFLQESVSEEIQLIKESAKNKDAS